MACATENRETLVRLQNFPPTSLTKEGVNIPVPVRGLGYFSANSKQEEYDFARAYAENLSDIKADYKARGIFPTQREIEHARIKSAVYAVTDLRGRDSMGAFFLDSQEPEDDMYDNFMPTLDWF